MNNLKLTQEEKDRILNLHENFKKTNLINEQVDGYPFHKAVQRFLNDKYKSNLKVDGQLYKTGAGDTESQKYIKRYQTELNKFADVGVDGRFEEETKRAMPESDWNKLVKFYNEEKSWFDGTIKR
jgi:hypothetical protein